MTLRGLYVFLKLTTNTNTFYQKTFAFHGKTLFNND
jgi:hypothetical protein